MLVDECKNRTGGCSRRPTLKVGKVDDVGERKGREDGKKVQEKRGGKMKGREVVEKRERGIGGGEVEELNKWEGLLVDECELPAGKKNRHEGRWKTGRDVLAKAIRDAEKERVAMNGEIGGKGEEGVEREGEETEGRTSGKRKVSTWWGLEEWVGGDDERVRVYAEVS